MKTVLSVLCMISLSVLLTSCKSDSDGSSGGRGDFPDVSYARVGDSVTCYNANSNVYTGGKQVCTWNCAFYDSSSPRWVQLTFDNALVCEDTGIDTITGEPIQTCTNELALVKKKYAPCVL